MANMLILLREQTEAATGKTVELSAGQLQTLIEGSGVASPPLHRLLRETQEAVDAAPSAGLLEGSVDLAATHDSPAITATVKRRTVLELIRACRRNRAAAVREERSRRDGN